MGPEVIPDADPRRGHKARSRSRRLDTAKRPATKPAARRPLPTGRIQRSRGGASTTGGCGGQVLGGLGEASGATGDRRARTSGKRRSAAGGTGRAIPDADHQPRQADSADRGQCAPTCLPSADGETYEVKRPAKREEDGAVRKPLERDVQKQILAYLRTVRRWTVVRVNSGAFRYGNNRLCRLNDTPGVADVIGVIPPAGRFLSVEIKRPGGKAGLTASQEAWRDAVLAAGGLAIVVDSLNDLIAQLGGV